MHTDELRAELAELANDVDPFAENLPAIRRRVARRRALIGSIATIVSIALIVSVVVVTRSSPSQIHVAGTEKQTPIEKLPRVDALVVLPAGATQADADAVTTILDSTSAVERYSALAPSTLARALGLLPSRGAKTVRGQVCSNLDAARGYAMELARAVPQAPARLESALGSHATSFFTKSATADAEVFMTVNAPESQVAAVREHIAATPEIAKSTFLDHQAAYREFAKLFADEPGLVAQAKSAELPESFRIQVEDGASIAAVAQQLRGLPGVDSVNTPDLTLFREPPVADIPSGDVEIFMQVKASASEIEAVNARLHADPNVASFLFQSHADAFREFKKLFADQPDLIKNTTADALPTSFLVTLRNPTTAIAFENRYASSPGVDDANEPGRNDPCAPNPINP
jgi:cell division protein FtsX